MLAADEKSNKSGIKQLSHGQQGDTVVYSPESDRYISRRRSLREIRSLKGEYILYLPVGRVITVLSHFHSIRQLIWWAWPNDTQYTTIKSCGYSFECKK